MKATYPILLSTKLISLALLWATSAWAQDVLPFPDPPMGGEVGPTMQESVHQWREAPNHLPKDAPNILIGSPVANDYFDKAPFKFEGALKRLYFKNL